MIPGGLTVRLSVLRLIQLDFPDPVHRVRNLKQAKFPFRPNAWMPRVLHESRDRCALRHFHCYSQQRKAAVTRNREYKGGEYHGRWNSEFSGDKPDAGSRYIPHALAHPSGAGSTRYFCAYDHDQNAVIQNRAALAQQLKSNLNRFQIVLQGHRQIPAKRVSRFGAHPRAARIRIRNFKRRGQPDSR